jgi:demethylmenaquinone methyltransferase / 2-methoxy-6-polyprenyl-1,4-benzoquinol methylase
MVIMPDKTVSFGFKDVAPDEKARRVHGVFSSVAARYDLMNDLMSAGVHRIWKANLIARLNPQPGEVLIDVAGGTGDIARAFLKAAARRAQGDRGPALAYVADMTEAMVMAGRRAGEPQLRHVVCDAARLPFRDRSADAVTISFGIRNVVDIDGALREFRRVLKPGGRFACLEFSQMTHGVLQAAYDRYSFAVIPRLGELVTGDRDSYQYLVESIRRFPDQRAFADRIRAAGFSGVAFTNYSGGVSALHTGWAA